MKITIVSLLVSVLSLAVGAALALVLRPRVSQNTTELQIERQFALRSNNQTERDIAEATEINLVVNQLNQGKIDAAKSLLNLKLDTYILSIDASLEESNNTNRVAANQLLLSIANARKRNPVIDSEIPKSVSEKVATILDNATKSNKSAASK